MRARLERSPFTLPVLLGIFFLSVYLLTGSSDLQHNGDTDLRYQTTQAIVDHHRLWIADPMWKDTRVATGIGGHLYAFYAPGQALFMVPLYLAGKVLAHRLDLPYDVTTLYASRSLDLFLGAALAVVFFLMARSVGYGARVAVALTLIFGLATSAWPDAQSALEQTQVDLFLLLAVFFMWRYVRGGMDDRRWLALSGLATGLCVFTRYDAVLFLPLVGGYPALLRWRTGLRQAARDALIFLAGAAPMLALVAGWNVARFASPFQTGLHEQTLGEPFWRGFLGLTISPGKGLIWYLPLVALLPWAVPPFYRRLPSLAIFFGALILVPLLFYSNILYWHGDPAWGPRYLYTGLPYLILPAGELLTRWRRLGLGVRAAILAVIALSFVIQLSAVSVTQWRFWYRLEVAEQRTSQPFHWGARNYHYYWQISQSPILIQLDDVYQVVRLNLGEQRYRLTAHPGPPTVSNPADNYPINTLAFWWADMRHPLFGARTRAGVAAAIAGIVVASLAALLVVLRDRRTPLEDAASERRLAVADL